MDGRDMVDSGAGREEEEGECARCKLSCLAQKTLRRIFDGIVSGQCYIIHGVMHHN